jgi:hypothetical protein
VEPLSSCIDETQSGISPLKVITNLAQYTLLLKSKRGYVLKVCNTRPFLISKAAIVVNEKKGAQAVVNELVSNIAPWGSLRESR